MQHISGFEIKEWANTTASTNDEEGNMCEVYVIPLTHLQFSQELIAEGM